MARGRQRNGGLGPRRGSVLLTGSQSSSRRRRSPRFGGAPRRRLPWHWAAALIVVSGVVAGGLTWRSQVQARDDRRAAAVRFAGAWERGDYDAMWRALTPRARAQYSEAQFTDSYRTVTRTAGVTSVRAEVLGDENGGEVSLAAVVRLRDFGILRDRMTLALAGSGKRAGVVWRPALVLPGLRAGERVRQRAGTSPKRAQILAADGRRLDSTTLGASIAGVTQPTPTGLQRVYDRRLAGQPSASLLFGSRVVARTRAIRGRPVRTTLRPGLMRAHRQRWATSSAAWRSSARGTARCRRSRDLRSRRPSHRAQHSRSSPPRRRSSTVSRSHQPRIALRRSRRCQESRWATPTASAAAAR